MHAFAKSRAAPASPEAQSARAYRRTPAVRNILRAPQVQTKLKIGAVDDPAEREADRVADQVMRMPDTALAATADAPPGTVQRACAECEGEIQRRAGASDSLLQRDIGKDEIQDQLVRAYLRNTETVQRKVDNPEEHEQAAGERILMQAKRAGPEAAAPHNGLESRVRSLDGGGQPLPDSVLRYMEPRFGHDFGNVRVHADANAAETARLANARAFTVGRNVVFGTGEYAPDASAAGRSLIAHELTHVIQQGRAGPSLQRRIMVGGARYVPTKFYTVYLKDHFGPAMEEFVERMDNSGNPPDYSFTNYDQMGYEIRIRADAIKGMEDVHKGCCDYYDSAHPPYLDSTYWTHLSGVNFKLKSPLPAGKQGSDAVAAIFASGAGTRLECRAMVRAIEYRSLLTGLGEAKFNALFPGGVGIDISLDKPFPLLDAPKNKYERATVANKGEILPGDRVYFKNFKDYTTRVPGGYWQGENAICMGIDQFRGFGVKTRSEKQMNQELVDKYNTEGKTTLTKTVADLIADGGGVQLSPVIRPIISRIAP